MMKISTKRLLTKLAMLAAFASSAPGSLALPDDNQQPINIQSDKATQKNLDGSEQTEYFGNVVMTQGSLLINGDHVIIHSLDRKVTHIIAKGNPAKFQQQSDPAKDPVKARANTIDYQLTTETVVLTESANIEQEGAIVSGNRIEYNVASEQVQAEDRVNMVFTPASVEPDTANSDSPNNNETTDSNTAGSNTASNNTPDSNANNNKGNDVDTDSQ